MTLEELVYTIASAVCCVAVWGVALMIMIGAR
jgi:hypothetical protein